jgi:hypothetical protein
VVLEGVEGRLPGFDERYDFSIDDSVVGKVRERLRVR